MKRADLFLCLSYWFINQEIYLVYPIISISVFLPLLGALLVMLMRKAPAQVAHAIGLIISGLTLLAVIVMWTRGINEVGFA